MFSPFVQSLPKSIDKSSHTEALPSLTPLYTPQSTLTPHSPSFISAPGQTSNAGCGIESSSASSFGTPFNGGGGGVYAMEWTTSSIKIWFFPRNSIPADLAAGNAPDPSKWSTPQASFQGGCDIGRHFVNHQIVIDTTFCGDWAGAVWPADW